MERRHSAVFAILCALVLTACVRPEQSRLVMDPDARLFGVINAVSMGCGALGDEPQHCNIWQGATLELQIGDQPLRIASGDGGSKTLVMASKRQCKTLHRRCKTPEANKSYRAVKGVMIDSGLTIQKINAVAVEGIVAGYLITTEQSALGALQSFPAPENDEDSG